MNRQEVKKIGYLNKIRYRWHKFKKPHWYLWTSIESLIISIVIVSILIVGVPCGVINLQYQFGIDSSKQEVIKQTISIDRGTTDYKQSLIDIIYDDLLYKRSVYLLSKASDKDIQSISDAGYTISIVSDYDSTYYDNEYMKNNHVYGITNLTIKTVYLLDDILALSDTELHEVGHVIDESFGMISESETFRELYNEHKNELNSYAATNSTEYFATAYNEYRVRPHKLEKNSPEIYKYFEKILGK